MAGDMVTYQHTIANTGNFTETFTLGVGSSQGWSVSVLPAAVSLGAGQSDTITVTVTIPLNALANTVDVTTVTATSTSPGPAASAAATDTTTVQGPGPGSTILYLPVLFTPCTPTGVDLVITDITITPNPPVSGQAATVQITVRNQGSVDMNPTNNFFLDFYVDRAPGYLLVGDIQWGVQASSFTAGASVTFSDTFIFPAGAHQVWAQVDTDNTVNECPHERNNIEGPLSLTVTGIDAGDPLVAPAASDGPRPTPVPTTGDGEAGATTPVVVPADTAVAPNPGADSSGNPGAEERSP